MKNIWKFISKYKLVVLLLAMIILGALAFVSMKSFLYPSDKNTVYGDRLDGIDKVIITDAKIEEISNKIKETVGLTTATVSIKGKVINIYIVATKKENSIEIMKTLSTEILKKFSEAELAFYDIQFFIKNEIANYNMIGYKNKGSKEISWDSDVIVSEVKVDEETEKE